MNKIKFNTTIQFNERNYAGKVHLITHKTVLPFHVEVKFENIQTMQT